MIPDRIPSIMKNLIGTVAAVALIWVAPAAAQAEDKIKKKDGSEVAGLILEWDYRAAKIQLPGAGKATQNLKTDDIDSVEWGGLTKEWKDADTDLKSGKEDAAFAKFKALAENKRLRAALRQEAMWNGSLASFRLGKDDEAVVTLKSMISDAEFPQSSNHASGGTAWSIHQANHTKVFVTAMHDHGGSTTGF